MEIIIVSIAVGVQLFLFAGLIIAAVYRHVSITTSANRWTMRNANIHFENSFMWRQHEHRHTWYVMTGRNPWVLYTVRKYK